jgi:hypothetical protein
MGMKLAQAKVMPMKKARSSGGWARMTFPDDKF